jgi:hypothetical protein
VIAVGPVEYGPIPALTPVSNALTDRCQGAASFRAADRTVFNTAGDEAKLYEYDPTTVTLSDISRLAGGAYATAIDDFWSYANFGSLVFAANGTDALQSFDIVLSTNYAAAAGSPPVARFVVICREFVVLGRLDSGVNRIRWCGIGAPTFWTIGQQQADEQIFADGGQVMGLVGGQGLVVFLETRIILGTYVGPGQIFQFDPISTDRGCAASMSIAPWQDRVFFLSHDGFYMLTGSGLTPIGALRVDQSFWSGSEGLPAVHPDYIYRTIGCVDPVRKLYLVAYASTNSADGTPDTVAAYAWDAGPAGRWSRANISIEFMYRARINAGVTLEGLDADNPDLDAMTVSLDSAIFAGSPQETLAVFGTDNKLGFLNGANMAAEIDTQEGELSSGEKVKVASVRPHVKGGLASEIEVAVGIRDNKLNDTVRWTADVTQRATGYCRFAAKRTKGRIHKARVKIAAGAEWTTFEGVDVMAQGAGDR